MADDTKSMDAIDTFRSYISSRLLVAKAKERSKLIQYKKALVFKRDNPGVPLAKPMQRAWRQLLHAVITAKDEDYDSDDFW
jgi:hypothetical protein